MSSFYHWGAHNTFIIVRNANNTKWWVNLINKKKLRYTEYKCHLLFEMQSIIIATIYKCLVHSALRLIGIYVYFYYATVSRFSSSITIKREKCAQNLLVKQKQTRIGIFGSCVYVCVCICVATVKRKRQKQNKKYGKRKQSDADKLRQLLFLRRFSFPFFSFLFFLFHLHLCSSLIDVVVVVVKLRNNNNVADL